MKRLLAAIVVVMCSLVKALASEPVVMIEDRVILTQLEGRGYGFEAIFGGADKPDLATLYSSKPGYRAMVDLIGDDIAALRAEMKAGGRPLYEVTDGNVGRIMDMRWLKTNAAHFRLIGVVNRLDRRDFTSLLGEKTCGEVRFVYRLAYEFKKGSRRLASRMPFNLNAVYSVAPDPDGECTGVAGRWTPQLDETVDAGWLTGGVLDRSQLTFKQLELNAQVVRFPSGQETEFGGQAAYLMRIFGFSGETLVEKPLENTPDVAKLKADAALKAELAAWLRENLIPIDQGVFEIPDKHLATKVISWSTFGSVRLGNHPFISIFTPADFETLDFAGLDLLRTPKGLIERLDNGACQGCHQAGSTAGFHLFGLDDDTTSPLNRLQTGISPHLHAELPRRQAWLKVVMRDERPNRFRPLSFAPPAKWEAASFPVFAPAKAGMPCLTQDDAKAYSRDWSCEAGLQCAVLASAAGVLSAQAQCLLPPESNEMFSGHPCLTGTIATNEAAPFNDRYKITGQFTAKAPAINRETYTCRPPKLGAPAGLAYRACTDRDRAFAGFQKGKPSPREMCGLVGGKKFDTCVATNDFDQCLGGAVNRGNRPTCDAENFCREDYMCQALPVDTPGAAKVKGKGFCSPTYFIFQMRIDNHATPWGATRAEMVGSATPVEARGANATAE